MRKLTLIKRRFRGGPIAKGFPGLVAGRGVRGDVNLTTGGRRFGRKEENKKGRKNERVIWRFEDLKI